MKYCCQATPTPNRQHSPGRMSLLCSSYGRLKMSGLEDRAQSTNGFTTTDKGSDVVLARQRLHSQSPLGMFLGSTGGSLARAHGWGGRRRRRELFYHCHATAGNAELLAQFYVLTEQPRSL